MGAPDYRTPRFQNRTAHAAYLNIHKVSVFFFQPSIYTVEWKILRLFVLSGMEKSTAPRAAFDKHATRYILHATPSLEKSPTGKPYQSLSHALSRALRSHTVVRWPNPGRYVGPILVLHRHKDFGIESYETTVTVVRIPTYIQEAGCRITHDTILDGNRAVRKILSKTHIVHTNPSKQPSINIADSIQQLAHVPTGTFKSLEVPGVIWEQPFRLTVPRSNSEAGIL